LNALAAAVDSLQRAFGQCRHTPSVAIIPATRGTPCFITYHLAECGMLHRAMRDKS
jgi:hypothetical protein